MSFFLRIKCCSIEYYRHNKYIKKLGSDYLMVRVNDDDAVFHTPRGSLVELWLLLMTAAVPPAPARWFSYMAYINIIKPAGMICCQRGSRRRGRAENVMCLSSCVEAAAASCEVWTISHPVHGCTALWRKSAAAAAGSLECALWKMLFKCS